MDISQWDAAIHYGIQLAQYCDQTRSLNAIWRRSPPVYSLALRLRNTKVPLWTNESIWYPKMDISHWDAEIYYGIQLAQYCDQTRSFNAISRRSPPVYSLALRLRNTKLPVLTHESIRYPKIYIRHWDAAIHYGIQLSDYCDQILHCKPRTPVNERLCTLCNCVEDELHFVTACTINQTERKIMYDKICLKFPNFSQLNDAEKFIFLFTFSDAQTLSWLGKYLYKSFLVRVSACSSE